MNDKLVGSYFLFKKLDIVVKLRKSGGYCDWLAI